MCECCLLLCKTELSSTGCALEKNLEGKLWVESGTRRYGSVFSSSCEVVMDLAHNNISSISVAGISARSIDRS